MDTVSEVGLLDAASQFIWEVEHEEERPVSTHESHALRAVSGALLRQLAKRFKSDALVNLTDCIVHEAYMNEVSRVVRGWPETTDFVRPMTFFGTAHRFRKAFAAAGLSEPPQPVNPDWINPALDTGQPVIVMNRAHEILFACPRTIYLWHYAEPLENASCSSAALVHPDDLERYLRDFQQMEFGLVWKNQTYRTNQRNPDQFTVLHGSSLYDDDYQYVGEMMIFKPIVCERFFDKIEPKDMLNTSRAFAELCSMSVPSLLSGANILVE